MIVDDASTQEIVDGAKGDYISDTRLSSTVMNVLKDGEQPHFSFKLPAGINRGGEAGFSDLAKIGGAANNDTTLFITDDRVVIIETGDFNPRAEHIPYENIKEVNSSLGGWLSSSSLKIKTENHQYGGKLHKNATESRLTTAKKYILSENRESPPHVIEEPDSVDGFEPIWCRADIEVEIVEAYGFDLQQEKYECEITPKSLILKKNQILGSSEKVVEVYFSEVDFDGVRMGSERDFQAENRSRTVNLINPIRESDAPTKKKKKSTVRFPIKDSNYFLTISPSKSSEYDALLNALSSIEEEKAENAKEYSEEGSSSTESDTPLETLKQRLAKGEITPDEFEKRKEMLEESN